MMCMTEVIIIYLCCYILGSARQERREAIPAERNMRHGAVLLWHQASPNRFAPVPRCLLFPCQCVQ